MSVSKAIFYIAFCCLFYFISCPKSLAQKSKAQLQQEKKENLQKIEEAKKILAETTSKKKNTLGQLNALNQRIKAQQDLISSIRAELNLLNEDIEETNLIIDALEEDIQQLKEEYSAMVYAAYKANQGFNKLTFIFSASSFNEFLMRLQYMGQYSETRKKQADQIVKVQKTLTDQITVIESKRSEKNSLLAEQLKESRSLTTLKSNQSSLVANLRSKENQLQSDMEKREAAVARLDKLIKDIIKEELAKAEAATDNTSSLALSNQFADNKAKLPWPVSGFITQEFGRHPHPVLKGITVNSTGINIQTRSNEKVKAIFNGEVTTVAFIKTLGNAVFLKHGDYFTVYAGLKKVYVKIGQSISTNQEIGEVLTDANGVSELKFELHKSTTPLDPKLWLTRK